jgi:hypothetical protein
VNVHAWSWFKQADENGKAQDGERVFQPVMWCVERLPANIRAVSPEELVWRIRMKHNPEQTRQLIQHWSSSSLISLDSLCHTAWNKIERRKYYQTRVEGRSASALLRRDKKSRAGQAKRYEPVREFERATSYCPLYLAWRILNDPSSQCFDATWGARRDIALPGNRRT